MKYVSWELIEDGVSYSDVMPYDEAVGSGIFTDTAFTWTIWEDPSEAELADLTRAAMEKMEKEVPVNVDLIEVVFPESHSAEGNLRGDEPPRPVDIHTVTPILGELDQLFITHEDQAPADDVWYKELFNMITTWGIDKLSGQIGVDLSALNQVMNWQTCTEAVTAAVDSLGFLDTVNMGGKSIFLGYRNITPRGVRSRVSVW